MKSSIKYLSVAQVLFIHDRAVKEFGGSFGIRDMGLVESAVARPQATFDKNELYITIFDKAAALFHSLIFNHAFTDGNKRTSLTATARFLYVNKYELKADEKELIDFPLRVENKHLDIEQISKWLKEHTKKDK